MDASKPNDPQTPDGPAAARAGGLLASAARRLMAGLRPARQSAASPPSADPPPPGVRLDGFAQAVLDAFPQAAFIVDAAGTVRHANSRAGGLFASTRVGDPLTFTFRAPELAEALREAGAGRGQSVEFHPPGESNVYAVSFSPLAGDSGGGRSVLVTLENISDRLAIARMRADFVANASHELRTPLASLTGFIETLLGPARNDPAAQEKFLGIMLDQARRMRRLVDDLLSLSRAEMRVFQRPTGRVDLSAILQHVRDALTPLAREQGVSLDLDLSAPSAEVTGDRDELIQVFQNLMENAIRYGAAGKRVEVTLTGAGAGGLVVGVRDFGPGIPPEHVPRLTERFYRVDVGASREMKGTGLGLAIVKHILTRHRGSLSIDSRPGEGALFTVELPRPEP